MFEITTFELRRRGRGMIYLSISLVAYAWLVIGIYPSMQEAGVDFEEYINSLPREFQTAFGANASAFTSIEGFLAVEMYMFVIVLILGMYFAYAAASTIATEVDDGSIDLLLVHPISRSRYAIGKYLSLIPVMVVVNAAMFFGTWVGVGFIGEEIDLANVLIMHLMSLPYLLACAALGLLASVHFGSPRRAQMVGAGGVFGMYLVHTVTLDRDLEWLGAVAFARYYDASEIVIDAEYDVAGVAILLAAAIFLVIVSAEYFERKDIA